MLARVPPTPLSWRGADTLVSGLAESGTGAVVKRSIMTQQDESRSESSLTTNPYSMNLARPIYACGEHPNSASGEAAADSAGKAYMPLKAPDGFFWFAFCESSRPLGKMKYRGNTKICQEDHNAYVSLSARWTANKKLLAWWTSPPTSG